MLLKLLGIFLKSISIQFKASMQAANRGILYIATGERHCLEAIDNAQASRSFAGDMPIVLITDCLSHATSSAVFDAVIPHPDPRRGFRDKIAAMSRLPFARTLFLDSDARLIAPASALFQAQGIADLAAVHAPVRLPAGWRDPHVPVLFSEINSGVLLWRRSRKQRALVSQWLRLYDHLQASTGQSWDQASLRSVLWHFVQRRRFRLSVLPSEANFRTTKPWVAGRGLSVHVLHGRVPADETDALLKYINSNVDRFRTWVEWNVLYPNTKLRLRIGEPPPGPRRG